MQINTWIKSSFSNGSGGNNCVEAMWDGRRVWVRSSTDPQSGMLGFTRAEWEAFTAGVEDQEFDLDG